MTSLDRRRRSRHRGWVAARLGHDGGGGHAVAHNVSENGILLVSRHGLPVGDAVHLSLHVDPVREPPWMLGGTVVRSRVNEADPHGLWPYKVAIEFTEPMPEIVDSMLAGT